MRFTYWTPWSHFGGWSSPNTRSGTTYSSCKLKHSTYSRSLLNSPWKGERLAQWVPSKSSTSSHLRRSASFVPFDWHLRPTHTKCPTPISIFSRNPFKQVTRHIIVYRFILCTVLITVYRFIIADVCIVGILLGELVQSHCLARKSTSYNIILESNADYFPLSKTWWHLVLRFMPGPVDHDFNPKAR